MMTLSHFPAVALFFVLLTCLQLTQVFAISPLSAVGSKFFTQDGKQFFMRGVAYQLVPKDPLVDTEQCNRDVALMRELGVNAIRVYHVDPDADHDGCMSALADAGIYLFVDLDDFPTQIEETEPHWNESQFESFKRVLDEFQQYDNTAGVFVGNEVLTTSNGARAAPFVLAAARDIKVYRDSKGYRQIPVGYSAADIADLRPMLQNYLVCSSDPLERLDFFALNAYEWCGDSSYTVSGYNMLQKNASGYPVPIFFSETGCNTNPPRDFMDQTAIFGPEMSGTWSGVLVYEWIQEANNYGLISYGPPAPDADPTNTLVYDGFTRQGTPTPVVPDFENLKSRWATLTPSGVALTDYAASASSLTPPPCPASTAGGWDVDPKSPLPTLGQTMTLFTRPAAAPTTGAASVGVKATGPVARVSTNAATVKTGGANRISAAASGGAVGLGKMVVLLSTLAAVVGWWL